jgi:hypothetical protein
MEQIYTIPINETFDAFRGNSECHCPICALYDKLQENELEIILGASMMEPDIRIMTNKEGFCGTHFDMMFAKRNRLGLALMMQSHLDKIRNDIKDRFIPDLIMGKGSRAVKEASRLKDSCYICRRVEHHMANMISTVLLLWQSDLEFRRKLKEQPYFCLPHYSRLLDLAKKKLSKKEFSDFYSDISQPQMKYLDSLYEDVSHFCRKFDYRYEDEPWGNSKDSVERTIKFLSGTER